MDFKDLAKLKIEGNEDVFYVGIQIQRFLGHSNLKQSISRSLSKDDYILISKSKMPEVMCHLIDNNILSPKARKSYIIKESAFIKLALNSKSKNAKSFLSMIADSIVKARKEYEISVDDFTNVLFNSYEAEKKSFKTYVMYDELSDLYKIGASKNIEFREQTLSSQIPKIKTILYLDSNKEKMLHNLFKDKRVRGEWFKLDSDDIITLVTDYSFKKFLKKLTS